MSMGKGPGGGGFSIPTFTPQTPYAPTMPFQPFEPPRQQSFGSYDPMMDMYGSTTRVMQPMPNYFSQFSVPGGYQSQAPAPAPPPAPLPPIPTPQPQPNPYIPAPFNPFPLNLDFGYYNGMPITDETYNSEPPPQQQPTNFQIDLAPPPPNFYGGINPGGMYTQQSEADPLSEMNLEVGVPGTAAHRVYGQSQSNPAAEIGNLFGNIRPSITSAETGVPASDFVNPGRPESTLNLSQPGRGTSGLPQTRNELRMPILDAVTVGRKDPAPAAVPTPVAPPPEVLPAPNPGFGGYVNNVRISPFMGGFNFGGLF